MVAAAVRLERPPLSRGLTLIELMVVLLIIGIGTSVAILALRDPGQAQLQDDATRLAALLEGARAASRAQDAALRWRTDGAGFRFEGQAGGPWPDRWLHQGTVAQVLGASELVLGPEPVIAAQSVLLARQQAPGQQVWVATDGVRPFEVLASSPAPQR